MELVCQKHRRGTWYLFVFFYVLHVYKFCRYVFFFQTGKSLVTVTKMALLGNTIVVWRNCVENITQNTKTCRVASLSAKVKECAAFKKSSASDQTGKESSNAYVQTFELLQSQNVRFNGWWHRQIWIITIKEKENDKSGREEGEGDKKTKWLFLYQINKGRPDVQKT